LQAIEQAGSTDPTHVALALENMSYDYLYGAVQMRADNHQLIQGKGDHHAHHLQDRAAPVITCFDSQQLSNDCNAEEGRMAACGLFR